MPIVAWRPVSMASRSLVTDAVGARHQHRLAITLQRNLEQRAETAEAAEHLGAQRAFDGRLDAFDQLVARLDVDAGVFVGNRIGHGDLRFSSAGLERAL
jgi:hypothetical protein